MQSIGNTGNFPGLIFYPFERCSKEMYLKHLEGGTGIQTSTIPKVAPELPSEAVTWGFLTVGKGKDGFLKKADGGCFSKEHHSDFYFFLGGEGVLF